MIRAIHLWLGLSLGGLFALLGLTGSALLFYQDIDALLNPEIRMEHAAPAPGWDAAVWDRALATARSHWPQQSGAWRFEANGKAGPIPARFYPSDGDGHMTQTMMVWISPDGRQVLRQDRWGDYAMTWIYDLHMTLLSGETGQKIAGWSGLAMLVLLGTGLAAWWPKGQWRKALAFKRRAVPLRRLYDLHKLAGLWSLLLLLILTGTGVMLALPQQSDWLLSRTLAPIDPVPNPQSLQPSGPQISIAVALAAAHKALPQSRLAWIEIPALGQGVFKIRVQQPSDPSARFPHSFVYIDQHDGQVLAVLDASKASASTNVNNWLHSLHDASIGGITTRILALIVGLAPALLFISGLLRWHRRHRVSVHSDRNG